MEIILFELFCLIACVAAKTTSAAAASCEFWSSAKGTFKRASSNSKYVYFTPFDEKKTNIGSWSEANTACKGQDMSMAVISSTVDAASLKDSFKKQKFCEDSRKNPQRIYWLGVNDNSHEGNWIDINTGKRIEFQSFYHFEPLNTPKLSTLLVGPFQVKPLAQDYANYGVLKCVDQNEIAMFESHQNGSAGVLCQYEKKHSCYKSSAETIANAKLKDTLDYLGKTSRRTYYISKKQRSWGSSSGYCKAYGAKLLDFDDRLDFGEGVDDNEINQLYKLLLGWKTKLGLPLWAHSIWTSGRYKNFKEDDYFTWNTTQNPYSLQEDPLKLKFIEDEYYTIHKTYDPFGQASFECISVTPLKTATFAVGSAEDVSLNLVRSTCTVPHWFVCYGNAAFKLPNKPISPIPDPEDDDGSDGGGGGGGGGGDGGKEVPLDPKSAEWWQWKVIAV